MVSEKKRVLTLLCLLFKEDKKQLNSTRTGLYSSIHKFIVKNAARRLKCSEKEFEELLHSLSKLAYEAYQRGDYFIREENFESSSAAQRILEIGYITRDIITCISVFETDERYGFPHKTFMEFLCARYLSENEEERKRFIILSFQEYKESKPIILFLFGLLSKKPS